MGKSRINSLEGKTFEIRAYGKSYKVVISVDHYRLTKAAAIQLNMVEDGEPWCTLTCNIPGTVLADNEILVKTWSENEETAKCALASGLFRDTRKRVSTGFVQAQIWEVL